MSEAEGKEWSKRYSWAACREPYKTELDTIGSHWIEGSLSNEELAFEAVQMLSELEWVSQPDAASRQIRLDDVISQVKMLTKAMLAVSERPAALQTPTLRRQALDYLSPKQGLEPGQ